VGKKKSGPFEGERQGLCGGRAPEGSTKKKRRKGYILRENKNGQPPNSKEKGGIKERA